MTCSLTALTGAGPRARTITPHRDTHGMLPQRAQVSPPAGAQRGNRRYSG
jgi:hypothetical protein